jgi:hypothetical protein
MESAFEKTARLLLTHPKKDWTGVELSTQTGYSPGMISRVLQQLGREVVVAKPYKNRFVLVEPIRLLFLWSCKRKLPAPIYVDSGKTEPELDELVRKVDGVALTGFRGAWLRNRYMWTSSYELYASKDRIQSIARSLGRRSKSPGRISLMPAEEDVFIGSERVDGLPVVSLPQNFVDLMCTGGSGPRVAMHLGIASGLLGV